jgi:hypothetical protein
MTALPDTRRLRAAAAALASRSEVEHGVAQLRDHAVHADRDTATLTRWSTTALQFADEMRSAHSGLADPEGAARELGVRIADDDGRAARWVLAEYRSRGDVIAVVPGTVGFAERIVEILGWSDRFPPGSIRRAAIGHELAHRILAGAPGRELRDRLGMVALRVGRFRRCGSVLGADELVAHAVAGGLLLPAVLRAAVALLPAPVRTPLDTSFLPAVRRRSLPWAS